MTTDAAATATPRSHRMLRLLRRIPATLALVALLLAVGVLSAGLWTSFAATPGMQTWAYGLPALEAARWWTPLTGTFLVAHPWIYPIVLATFVGMGFLEFRRGTLLALAYFFGGQLFAVLGAALVLWLLSFTGWGWAVDQAAMLDVGPSGGTFACLAAAISLFPAPWRVRAWLVLLAYVFVTMLFWGSLDDIEHLLAVVLVLFVDRTLRIQRTSVREQRLVAFVSMLVLAALEIVVLLVPTNGPFGSSEPASGSFLDVAVDVVIVAIIANGLRRGRRWAWVLGIILCALNVAILALLVALIAVAGWAAVDSGYDGDPSLTLATSSAWLFVLVYLVWVRRAFRARRRANIGIPPRPTVDDVKSELRAHGGGTLSWMTTWDGNHYARTETGMVAFQNRAGVALALADPLGPEPGRAASVRSFIDGAERAGLVPCFFSASEATRSAVPASWRSLIVADDTIVDLPGLEFTGKAWGAVRSSINRAERERVTFRMTRLGDESWGIRQQLRAISEGWVGDKGLPEMGFTLGTLGEAADPEVRVALAVSERGDVDGFLSWLPIYGPGGVVHGWTLDLMRRREGGFAPVMEFLIGSSARMFSEEGAQVLSLSGAPLTHEYPPGAGLIAELSARLADALEPVYGFQSLHRFKQKFHPRYETMYLLYRDESDLSRIGLGLTRAFLPTATLRQFAGAGLELVRGG
jgi:phosphatidylglycerol lysyltransferase